MEQLGRTVAHNADGARRAERPAEGASAVATMQGISDRSRKIGNTIV